MSKAPLAGCRVLLTRPTDQATPWREALTLAGAIVIDHPTIEVGPPPSWAALDAALGRIDEYDWIVFTSATVVRFVFDRWAGGAQVLARGRPRVAAVGRRTAAALTGAGVTVALCPSDERQEGLVAAFAGTPPGTRVLFPRALGGRDHLIEALGARGITVELVPASETRARAPLPPPPPFDVATFASPSALAAFVAALGRTPLDGKPVIVIGATTAEHARSLQIPAIAAARSDIAAIIAAITDAVANARAAGAR